MYMRKIKSTVTGSRATDGAGVRLVRVLGARNVESFDPFLMLDSFDSKDPEDYTKGFPMHPHRGIETVTYLIEGRIDHKDSLGNSGSILSGDVQWMTAGSGILHEEMPKIAPRMLGLQLWLNLPATDKMTNPGYFAITSDMIKTVSKNGALIKVISGSFEGVSGVSAPNVNMRMLDVQLDKGASIKIASDYKSCLFIFIILGSATVCGQPIEEKTAVLFDDGDYIEASTETGARIIIFEAPPLKEAIAWGGPIVMNTQKELELAFDELQSGTFIKHRPL